MSGDAKDYRKRLIEHRCSIRNAAPASRLPSNAAILQIKSDELALEAKFDRERLLQVLANLITNAIKFTHRGGQIRIRSGRAGNAPQFSVSDSGCGIPSHMLETIFERFWQVGKHDRRGLGLGLYISKCVVEAHGGAIWAESELGVGTTVHFTLPIPGTGKRPVA